MWTVALLLHVSMTGENENNWLTNGVGKGETVDNQEMCNL